jgi:hypothetical protein
MRWWTKARGGGVGKLKDGGLGDKEDEQFV